MIGECPNIEALAAYGEHKLEAEEVVTVEAHLAECSLCRQTVILCVRNKGLIEDFALPADS